MATRTHVETVCDLQHKAVRGSTSETEEVPAVEPAVILTINGKTWRLDLCESHKTAFEKAIAPYTDDRLRFRERDRVSRRPHAQARGADAATMRQWGRQNGFEVNDRGRVSAALREAYLASAGSSASAA